MADINSLDDIFNSDEFGLLNTQNEVDIHTLKNVPKVEKRADADFVARREKFDDFDKYEQLFIDCQNDLKANRRQIVPSVESQLDIGTFCVLDGVLLYIADIQDGYRGNSGKINRRTTIIFENGTKSNMLLRSLGKRLKDSGNMVTKLESEKDNGLFDVTNDDTQNGYIYILKSLSNEDTIKTKRNLYKIGFSTTSVETRIKNAKKDPTYLMAEVKTVAAYEVYKKGIESDNPEVAANVLLSLINVTTYLLTQQLKRLEADFLKEGGLRERMTKARIEVRKKQK